MHNNTYSTPFPLSITGAVAHFADEALALAQNLYEDIPDAPRSIEEAMDEFQLRSLDLKIQIVGTKSAPFSETTLLAAMIAVPWMAVIAEQLDDDGHGSILLHSPGDSHDIDDRDHKLLLVVWDAGSQTHTMVDVTGGVRIERYHHYNEEIAARLEPHDDGSFSHPEGVIRYVKPARDIMEGTKLVYQNVVRTVVECSTVPLMHDDHGDHRNMICTVSVKFADGLAIRIPGALEITYVDKAG